MIRGLGCDLCAVARMEKIIQDGRFLARYYTEAECAYIRDRKMQAQTAAGLFAAKEAFLKAIGVGLFSGVALADIEVVNEESGRPAFALGPSARAALERVGASEAFVTLSHVKSLATATVVVRS